MNKTVKIGLAVVAALLVLGFGGSWVYINLIKEDTPERLDFDDAESTATSAASDPTDTTADAVTTTVAAADQPAGVDGTWTVGEGSQAGYRVGEILFGQDTEGVGRTEDIEGTMSIDGTTITATTFTVDMASVTSDESRRDSAFRGDIMSTSEFPTSTFELRSPITLDGVPGDGEEVTVTAEGELTLRGTAKDVSIDLTAKRSGETIQVLGNFEVVFADWGIPDPSRGPVSVEDRGLLELLLVFRRA